MPTRVLEFDDFQPGSLEALSLFIGETIGPGWVNFPENLNHFCAPPPRRASFEVQILG